jgi:hypothetical protein
MRPTSLRILCCVAAAALPLSSPAQDTSACRPPCRPAFTCLRGQCVSLCNPPCAAGEWCTQQGECVTAPAAANYQPAAPARPKPPPRKIPCADVFIVRPVIDTESLTGHLEPAELLGAEMTVVNAIASRIPANCEAISPEEVSVVRACRARLVVAQIKSYYVQSAILGQHTGTATITVATYDSLNAPTPTRVQEFSAEGKRHWGDATPLQNAFEAVSGRIRLGYRFRERGQGRR